MGECIMYGAWGMWNIYMFHMPQLRMAPDIDPEALSLKFIHAEKADYNARANFLPHKQICALIIRHFPE